MNFYLEWKNNLSSVEENEKFIKKFLSKSEDSNIVFINGTNEELVHVCKFLLDIPIGTFICYIDENKKCSTDMIIQYSNLEHAIVDVARVLKFINKPLTFAELGKIIINAREEGACKKYGENHSKLANELSMVLLERKGSTYVSNTSFGNFSVGLSDKDRIELVKRLVLRNEFIQKLIYLAKRGIVSYMDVAKETLSESTAIRRKSNVRQIITLVLNGNELINNIIW